MKELLEDVKAGKYDDWAEQYVEDRTDPHLETISKDEALAAVKDFLWCRLEEKKSVAKEKKLPVRVELDQEELAGLLHDGKSVSYDLGGGLPMLLIVNQDLEE